MNNKTYAFTLIEILVVATIAALLAAVGATSFVQFSRQSRDAKRKADIEQVRAAIEMFRSNSATGSYPDTGTVTFATCTTIALSDGTNTYISKLPQDPKCSSDTPRYYYTALNASDGACDDNLSTNPCVKYVLGAALENKSLASLCQPANSCGTNCNYCVGPYGEQ